MGGFIFLDNPGNDGLITGMSFFHEEMTMIIRRSIPFLLLGVVCIACQRNLTLPTPTPELMVNAPTTSISATQPAKPTSTITPEPSPSPTSNPISNELFQPVFPEKEFPSDLVSILRASDDGSLWLQTQQQILTFKDNMWEIVLADIPGKLAGVDPYGLIWVINQDGNSISSWDGNIWNTYSEESGWTHLSEYSFVKWRPIIDQYEQMWIVTSEDLRVFDGQGWECFSPKDIGFTHPLEAEEDVLPDLYLKYLARSEELWVGSCNWTGAGPIGGQGVRRYDGYSWEEINSVFSSGCTEAIEEDGDGSIWFGLDGDVWRYDPETGTQDKFAAPPTPFEGSSIFAWVGNIVVDTDNTPWADLGVCGGGGCGFGTILYHLDQGEWIEVIQEDYTYHEIFFDQSGNLWLSTPGGIFKIVDNYLEMFIELPMTSNSVVKSPDGQIWFLVTRDDRRELWTLKLDS